LTRGGKREGAGRKTGEPNKKTADLVAKVEESGITPLDYMLNLLHDETAEAKDRMWAAEKAAPYVHAKLASVEHKGDGGGPLQVMITRFAETK